MAQSAFAHAISARAFDFHPLPNNSVRVRTAAGAGPQRALTDLDLRPKIRTQQPVACPGKSSFKGFYQRVRVSPHKPQAQHRARTLEYPNQAAESTKSRVGRGLDSDSSRIPKPNPSCLFSLLFSVPNFAPTLGGLADSSRYPLFQRSKIAGRPIHRQTLVGTMPNDLIRAPQGHVPAAQSPPSFARTLR